MMKKNYEKPTVEVVKFQYRDQVVVASTSSICNPEYTQHLGTDGCEFTGIYHGNDR